EADATWDRNPPGLQLGPEWAVECESEAGRAIEGAKRVLLEARGSLKVSFLSWLFEQGEPDRNAHTSEKVKVAASRLREEFARRGRDMRCLVFTRTRASCQLIALYLQLEPWMTSNVDFVVGSNGTSSGSCLQTRQGLSGLFHGQIQ
ncbi:unnamed protein product, partial [Polarella glacialis]